MHLSSLGIFLNRSELVEQNPSRLPSSGELDPRYAETLAIVLRHSSDPTQSAQFAYSFLRTHFESLHAHRAMILSLFPPGPEVTLPQSDVAKPGFAVFFKETSDENGDADWYIIEDENEVDVNRHELASNHPISQQIRDKRVGDEFLLNPGSYQERKARITEIVHKYVARVRDSLSGWEKRFPNEFFVMQLKVKKEPNGDFDFAPLRRAVDKRHEAFEKTEQLYKEMPMPLHFFLAGTGNPVFETTLYALTDPELRLRCCAGNDDERDTALHSLRARSGIVIDITALAVLHAIEAADLLFQIDGIRIVQSTLDALHAFRDRLASKESEGFIGKHSGEYTMGRFDDARTRTLIHNELGRLNALLQAVEQRCVVVSGIALSYMEPNARNQLVTFFGESTAQSIAEAKTQGSMLWTDDLPTAAIAGSEHDVARVWTYIVAHDLCCRGAIQPERLVDLAVRLAAAGYSFTPISAESIVEAARRSNWDPETSPLRNLLSELTRPEVSKQSLYGVAARAIVLLWRDPDLRAQPLGVYKALFTHMACRAEGPQVIAHIERNLDAIFGVDVSGATAVGATMRVWRTLNSRIIIPPWIA